MHQKPNYAKRIFKAILITFGIALALFLSPIIVILIRALLGGVEISETFNFILKLIQYVMPVMVIIIGTPIAIIIACATASESQQKNIEESNKNIQ